jgi:hypothetical protein
MPRTLRKSWPPTTAGSERHRLSQSTPEAPDAVRRGHEMANISPSTITAYVAKRLKDTPMPANATVNRDLFSSRENEAAATKVAQKMTNETCRALASRQWNSKITESS